MKITMLFVTDEGPHGAWLESAYDEHTHEAWGEVPDFYREAIEKAKQYDQPYREVTCEIPFELVAQAFESVAVTATNVVAGPVGS